MQLLICNVTLTFLTQTDAGHTKKLHCGHLYKRGHLLRQWKARWFVLDTQRNQVLRIVLVCSHQKHITSASGSHTMVSFTDLYA